eukprot:scaffold647844_cov28-Prasinocladus_malaysianus.AAC.1
MYLRPVHYSPLIDWISTFAVIVHRVARIEEAQKLGYRVVVIEYSRDSSQLCTQVQAALDALTEEEILAHSPAVPCRAASDRPAKSTVGVDKPSLAEKVGPYAAQLITSNLMHSPNRWMLDLWAENPQASQMRPSLADSLKDVPPRGIILWALGRSGTGAFWETIKAMTQRSNMRLHPLCGIKEGFKNKNIPTVKSVDRYLSELTCGPCIDDVPCNVLIITIAYFYYVRQGLTTLGGLNKTI